MQEHLPVQQTMALVKTREIVYVNVTCEYALIEKKY